MKKYTVTRGFKFEVYLFLAWNLCTNATQFYQHQKSWLREGKEQEYKTLLKQKFELSDAILTKRNIYFNMLTKQFFFFLRVFTSFHFPHFL